MLNHNSIADETTPLEFNLSQNYPNPFKEKTTIKYCVPYKTRVQLNVYDSDNKLIEKLVDEMKDPGTHEVKFFASVCHSGENRNLQDGYYYFRLKTTDYLSEKKWFCINHLFGRLNMKNLLQTLFFFLLITQICFGQWFRQDNFPQTNSLSSVKFVDSSTGWAVGEAGTILKTIDGGLEWIRQESETNQGLRSVYFTDINNGWCVGGETILRTTDSGLNWTHLNGGLNYNLSSVHFFNSDIGWIAGSYNPVDRGHAILRTSNGGQDWIPFITTPVGSYRFNTVYFVDSLYGWVYGEWYAAYTTSDGGINWYQLPSVGYNNVIKQAFFINREKGWLVGGYRGNLTGRVNIRINGGWNWGGNTNPPQFDYWLNSVEFCDTNNGWIAGNAGKIYKSIDGGYNWLAQASGISNTLNSLDFVDKNNGWAVGDYGQILKTNDSGLNWINLTKETVRNLKSVCFINSNIGWAVGEDGSNRVNKILHTTNGGIDWTSLILNEYGHEWFPLNSVFFWDSNNGWLAGEAGNIFYTADGGNHWMRSNTGSIGESIVSIHFSDENNGWAIGGNRILKSINGGVSWTSQINDTLGNMNSIFFTNATDGYIVGSKSYGWYCTMAVIYRTTDGGNNWTIQLQDTNYTALSSVFFINESEGWAAGGNKIYHTTNSGLEWVKQTEDTTYFELSSINFADQNDGYAVGSTILKTSNGGDEWFTQNVHSNSYLNAVWFTDALTGWAVGEGGIILHTSNGGVTFIEDEQISPALPKQFALEQNYPNPFNPSTKISWQSPVGSQQTLKVYDVLGNEVATLVDEYKPVGKYEVEFNASALPSGVYFYQLTSGDFIQTRKMILIK